MLRVFCLCKISTSHQTTTQYTYVFVRARRVYLEDCEAQKWGVATQSAASVCRTCLERVKDFNLQTYPSAFTNELPDV